MELQLSYFKSWNMMLWKCYTQYASKFGKLSSENLENSTGLEKVSFHSNPKTGNAKECSNYCTIVLISHASKVTLKTHQARLHPVCELRNSVQAGFRQGRRTRDQIAIIHWIIEKTREFQKTSIFALLTTLKPLTMWITINCGKYFKRSVKYRWFNWDWLNIGKEVHQGCILSPY